MTQAAKKYEYIECCKAGFGYHEKSSEIVLHQVTTEQGFKDFLNLKNDFPITNGYIISPEFHAFVTEEVDEALSTWFYGLVHALQFCSQVLDLKTLALHLFSQMRSRSILKVRTDYYLWLRESSWGR